MLRRCAFLIALLAALVPAAQQPGPAPKDPNASYVLGPDDQLIINALEADEISNKPVRIDMSGNIRLPMVGRLRAAGLTVAQLEAALAERLKPYIHEPDISVSISEFRSQPVSVLGSVKSPGVHQLQGRKTLVEILSLAGGLADDAGHTLKITRRLEHGPIPLPSAAPDSSSQFSVASVSLKSIMEARNPEENIIIRPFDVVSVPRAEMVYVTGQVTRSGGFVLRERETLSVLQALSLAGGLDRTASPKNARILRASNEPGGRTEIPVDLARILIGRGVDVPMHSEDILFIPSSAPKKAAIRAMEAAVQIGTGLVIWRR